MSTAVIYIYTVYTTITKYNIYIDFENKLNKINIYSAYRYSEFHVFPQDDLQTHKLLQNPMLTYIFIMKQL